MDNIVVGRQGRGWIGRFTGLGLGHLPRKCLILPFRMSKASLYSSLDVLSPKDVLLGLI
jgi:hypothetical protein